MDDVTKAAFKAIKRFHWWNYGLDEVSETKSDDWAKALAEEVVDAVVVAERRARGGQVQAMPGGEQ